MANDAPNYQVPSTLNADFSEPVVIDSHKLPWLPSPQAGVERRLLERIGSEVARATSLVRYAPSSTFPSHTHGAGEEFLVLEGTFCDEHGKYPAGTYVRNPPGSSHAPFTESGCVILVKLRQMRASGEPHVVHDTNVMTWQPDTADGYNTKVLFDAGPNAERVTLQRLVAGASEPARESVGGEELFVIEGELSDGQTKYGPGTWLRFPDLQRPVWQSDSGCVFWVKRGHLPHE